MTDEFSSWLAKVRPHTVADDGWAASEEGDRALAEIHRAAGVSATSSGTAATPSARRLRFGRPWSARPGLIAAAAAVLVAAGAGVLATQPGSSDRAGGPPVPPPGHVVGPRPADMALVSYTSCSDLLAGLRAHAEKSVGPDGLPGTFSPYLYDAVRGPALAPAGMPMATQSEAAQPHSTTNVQEPGVDEPDIVKTDGSRIVSVSGGSLRVVDVRTRELTGSLDLTLYANWQSAQLLVSGDRALVVLDSGFQGGPVFAPGPVGTGPRGVGRQTSTYLLVDLSGTPKVIGTFRPTGSHLDARMVGTTVRLVVASSPEITFNYDGSTSQRLARNKATIRSAPLRAWLPTYEVTDGGVTTQHSVPCEQVSHPADYTAASMLTVYTLDLGKSLGDGAPVSVAADGNIVYATKASLYIASDPMWYGTPVPQKQGENTEIHRFDLTGEGAPTYLGSGEVPGRLLSQYSLSEYDGHLRVAATSGRFTGKTVSSVYVLDANTLKVTGSVGGLGRGQQVYAVRFLGPLGYVVTFRQIDPLYVIDLHDPTAPRTAGELELNGYSDYLHPVGDGRLVGVGQDATAQGRVTGLQVSLFDVSTPAEPRRVAHVVREDAAGNTGQDPHGFLYWPESGLLVVPIQSWDGTASGRALVLDVGRNGLTTVGLVSHPGAGSTYGGSWIERSMVIGNDLWTLSDAGLMASNPDTLARRAWIAFS